MMSQKKYILILAGCILLLGIMSFGLPAEAFADSSCAFTNKNEVNDDSTGRTTTWQKMASPFTVSSTCYPTDIATHIKTTGTPVDSVFYAIYDDNGGEPGTKLGQTANVAGITGSFAWATSTMASSITLNTSTTYWLVVERTGSLSDANHWNWYLSSNSPTYGNYLHLNGTWQSGGVHEAWFQIYGGAATGGGETDSSEWGGATSTIEQSQTNLFYGFFVFFVSFFGVVWLFRKNV